MFPEHEPDAAIAGAVVGFVVLIFVIIICVYR